MRSALQILLVEDNEGDVELTQRAFRDGTPACNITVANDGMEALDVLNKQGRFTDAPAPHLVLLDLSMQRMSGKKFLEIVKMDTQFKVIPVVVLTSSQSPADIRYCYERYASCYVVKPFNGKEFADAVQQVVRFWYELGQLP